MIYFCCNADGVLHLYDLESNKKLVNYLIIGDIDYGSNNSSRVEGKSLGVVGIIWSAQSKNAFISIF